MEDAPALESTRRWQGLFMALLVPLASGFLSWFSSYVLQGARLTNLESAFAAHVMEGHDTREKYDAQLLSLHAEQGSMKLEAEKRLTRLEDGVSEVKGLLQHLDGRLSGVTTAKGHSP